MISLNKITLLTALGVLTHLCCFSQVSIGEDEYNGFSSRSFMKFNNFMTVPTFSLLHREATTIEAITRNSNIEFQDASHLHLLSYSGRMGRNVGAGIAVFQQEIGVFKDFGAMANYAYQLNLGVNNKLTFGFNFFYSRRSINSPKVLSNTADPLINNYRDKPVVVLQPAATVSFRNFDIGLFFENLGDFNLKTNEFVTPFSDKTISGHAAYTYKFANTKGLFENITVRALAIGRQTKANGFLYAGAILADLPKAGWVKAGYDKLFGLNAGIGVNLNSKLSIGFSYEKQENLSGTNEVGLIYKLGRLRAKRIESRAADVVIPRDTPIIERRGEEYKNLEHNDLSGEIRIAQDSIDKLNKKVNEILKRLGNQPENTTKKEVIREIISPEIPPEITPEITPVEKRDKSLPRSNKKPWREQSTTVTGGRGTMYYVVFDQFKDENKAKTLVENYKKREINVRYVKDPKYDSYVVYFKRFSKEENADDVVAEINGTSKKGFEDNEAISSLDITNIKAIKKSSSAGSNNLYKMKITLGAEGETYKESKRQPPARVVTMRKTKGLNVNVGYYYLQIGVYSKKANADRLLDELENDNINADYFINPKTGFRHIYIHKTNNRAEIIKLYNNNLNGSYHDRKNIIYIR